MHQEVLLRTAYIAQNIIHCSRSEPYRAVVATELVTVMEMDLSFFFFLAN